MSTPSRSPEYRTLDLLAAQMPEMDNAVARQRGFVGVTGYAKRENYHAVMDTEVDLLKHPVVTAAVGTAAMAVGAAETAYRVAEKVPVFGSLMRRSVAGLSDRGDRWVAQSADQVSALVGAVAARLVTWSSTRSI
jgi:hypothetical protein